MFDLKSIPLSWFVIEAIKGMVDDILSLLKWLKPF